MKAKILLIIILFFLQSNCLFSQCISIELSITWQMGHDIFNKDSVISVPMLNITYRNDCNFDYYFLNVYASGNNLPEKFPCFLLDNIRYEEYIKSDYIKEMQLYGKYTNKNFRVAIRGDNYYSTNWWWVYCDSTDKLDYYDYELFCAYVNCHLKRIYAYICHDAKLEDNKRMTSEGASKLDFKQADLLPENLLYSVGERFVFLKSGETSTDIYNLIAFQIIEGCYTFLIDQDEIKKYVLGADGINTIELELPSVVGEYQLYSGAFNTNKVTVCFGEE